jgi:hypothetical protein
VLLAAAVIGYGCKDLPAETIAPTPDAGLPADAIGTMCVPSSEANPAYPGSKVEILEIESHFDACASGVCLVNHFQGRVSCPLGQAAPAACAHPVDGGCASASCQTASASDAENAGKSCCAEGSDLLVSTPVCGQCAGRSAAQSAYCSCRCGPADGDPAADGGTYCACPDGFACTPLVLYVGIPDPNAGKYCIKQGTAYTGPDQCGTVRGYFDRSSCSGDAGI